MNEYAYTAYTNAGRRTSGSITAENTNSAAMEIRRAGLTPLKISEAGLLTRGISFGFLKKKPSARDLSVFCRQFVSIIDAGVPIVRALDMLSEQTENKVLARALRDTRVSVEKGEALAPSLKKHEKIFGSAMFIALVAAGEASGSLGVSFSRMGDQYEKDTAIKSALKKAAVYPIIILIAMIGVIAVMLTFVIPQFLEIFNELGSELPGITKAIIAASGFMTVDWKILLFAVALLAVLLRIFEGTPAGKRLFGALVLKIPIVSGLIVITASARVSRTQSTLIASGIPLISALEIVEGIMGNPLFREALRAVRADVALGSPMSVSLKRVKLFPPMVHQMVAIGEESGDTQEMLGKIADYYEREVESATQQIMALIEPAIIIIMAAVVGAIVLAIMLPVANMYGILDSL
jgi:type IV pilus assembly protein PilC